VAKLKKNQNGLSKLAFSKVDIRVFLLGCVIYLFFCTD
jgi:hypothetical protein